jgi:hypothetical protein
LVVVPGLRADAVLVPFLVVLAPFLVVLALFLPGAAFFFAVVFRAAVFLAGAFLWDATAPSALQANTIIAAMAAQLKIFLIG